MHQPRGPRVLKTAEIPVAIALLERFGYKVTPPSSEAVTIPPEAELPETYWDDAVREAQELVDRLRLESEDADERCIHTPEDDRDLGRHHHRSIKLGHSLAEAEEDLRKAIQDRALVKGA